MASLEPADICAKLVAAKVAKNCSSGGEGTAAKSVRFDVVGTAGYEGIIWRYATDAAFKQFAGVTLAALASAPADDYPELVVAHSSSRTLITWSADLASPATKGSTDTPDGDRWTKCRERKSVTACAKAQPVYYSALKALHEAARRAVGPE